jgi:hypothetical protein
LSDPEFESASETKCDDTKVDPDCTIGLESVSFGVGSGDGCDRDCDCAEEVMSLRGPLISCL